MFTTRAKQSRVFLAGFGFGLLVTSDGAFSIGGRFVAMPVAKDYKGRNECRAGNALGRALTESSQT